MASCGRQPCRTHVHLQGALHAVATRGLAHTWLCPPCCEGVCKQQACVAQSLCMHVLASCVQAIHQVRVPETARLGITLRGLEKLTARLAADFAAGRLQRPASVAEADWPKAVEGLRTEHVNVAWVEEVTKGSRKRLIELLDYVAADDVAQPQLFISHACEV
jgi:hypothetical protein